MHALRTLAFSLFLPVLALAAPLVDPFSGPRGTLTTAAGGTGVAMDVAVSGNLLYLLDQDWEHEDQLFTLDRASGRVLRQLPLGKLSACAAATERDTVWVLRRGRQDFLRQLDAGGKVVASITPDALPPGKIYGLAVDAGGFFFTTANDDGSRVFRLARGERVARPFAAIDGKLLALALAGGRLYGAMSKSEPMGTDWLVAWRLDGTLEAKLRVAGTPMGLDSDGAALFAMFQHGPEADVQRLIPDPARHLVLGAANLKHVRITHRWEGNPGVPVVVRQTHSIPQDLEFQRIRRFASNAKLGNVTTDRDGNRWGVFETTGTGNAEITFEMDVAEVPVGFTIDPNAAPPLDAFPREALAQGLGETSAFDYSNPAVQRVVAAVPKAPSLAGLLLNVHDTVNDSLQIVGASGPEVHASDFLSQGIGRCYAHTLAFAAVARGLGLPTRAIGGIQLANGTDWQEGSEAGMHTWNQAYVPGTGWVDIDSQHDDDPSGRHSRSGIGRHVADYVITFVGSYGKKDKQTQFAERSWISGGWEGFSTQPGVKSGLDYKGCSVSVSDLPAW